MNDAKAGWWDEKDFIKTYKRMISDFQVRGVTKILVTVPTPLYKDKIYTMSQTLVNDKMSKLVP